jgi:hypothetical protein
VLSKAVLIANGLERDTSDGTYLKTEYLTATTAFGPDETIRGAEFSARFADKNLGSVD